MNPADVAQSVLPLTSSDLALFTLFWHAHWIVKTVMMGLLICSVWVWAIAIDKTVLYTRSKRAMDRFEQAFWSGQSLEELYRSLSSKPTHSMAALFVAAMREWKRSFEGQARFRGEQAGAAAGRLCRRVRRHPVAPDRRARVRGRWQPMPARRSSDAGSVIAKR